MNRNNQAIGILFAILFIVMVGFGIVIPIMPFFVTDLGGGPATLGLFLAAFSLMQFIFAPMWGRLSDQIGRRPILLIGVLGYAVTFVLFGLANKLWMVFVIRVLAGIVSSATLPTSMAYIADTLEGNERSRGMGLMGAAMGAGMIFGPAIGGWLGHNGFALPFFAAGGLAFLVWIFAFFFLPESLKVKREANSAATSKLSTQVVKHPLFLLFILVFVLNFVMAIFQATFVLLAAARAGFGPRETGLIFAVLGVIGIIVQGGLIGRLVKRFGDVKLVKAGMVIAALGMLSIAVSYHMAAVLITAAVLHTGLSLMSPSSSALVTKNTLDGQGASLGLMQSFGSLGRIIGPVIGGVLYDLNISVPYIAGTAVLLVMMLYSWKRINQYDPDCAESAPEA